ncbi:odorant receptor 33b-like [Teleopsis dalmanni]|uniref:odorant receptor 33b-like n=1 Tax=Teleopsis dalmanni TaxID=139649 RepID=UPI0018CD31A3|nr:odorant receptor 33b-like [Teleopsis dalmanni]
MTLLGVELQFIHIFRVTIFIPDNDKTPVYDELHFLEANIVRNIITHLNIKYQYIMLEAVDSVVLYDRFWMCWKLVGIATDQNKYICGLYDLCLNIFVTIFYPLHLTIGLFMEPTLGDVFKNLAINVTCIVCSLKHLLFRYKLKKIRAVQSILHELDRRVVAAEERKYFSEVPKASALLVVNAFFTAYIFSNITAIAATLLASEPRLMYPAWLPFDWSSNTFTYWAALLYQFVGITIQIIQNLANDIYAPMSLCIFAGHVHMLGMRLSKLGHNPILKQDDVNKQLLQCIEDHKLLLKIFYLLQDTLSLAQLAQFISSGLNICIVLVYLLFFADNIFSYIYYSVYFVSMTIEIFPCCYYGSILQEEFANLPYAVFKSNWLESQRNYRRHMIIFTVLAQKQVTPLAGGIIAIHLNAFFTTCKMAYSLFAVLRQN